MGTEVSMHEISTVEEALPPTMQDFKDKSQAGMSNNGRFEWGPYDSSMPIDNPYCDCVGDLHEPGC